MRLKTHGKIMLFLLSVLLTAGCSAIDDDLSDCPPPSPPVPPVPDETEFELNYELRLVTNITTEMNTQLSTTTDVNVANALRSHLQDIFTDYAHDVDLSFYDTENNQETLHHEAAEMNASEKSYTIYLPVREYQHLAVANIKNNQVVELKNIDRCPTSHLVTKPVGEDNTIDSHSTGLFTARQPIAVREGVDQTFHVRLYMANCAEALVIDPRGHNFSDIKVYTKGFASEFNINDSTYVFAETTPRVKATQLDTEGGKLCFCSVNFPSKEKDGAMRTVIETEEPFIEEDADEALWQIVVYVTKADGTVTESVLNVKEVMRAGQFKIINAYFGDDGDVCTNDQTVGVSVTLNWNDGGHHEIDL